MEQSARRSKVNAMMQGVTEIVAGGEFYFVG